MRGFLRIICRLLRVIAWCWGGYPALLQCALPAQRSDKLHSSELPGKGVQKDYEQIIGKNADKSHSKISIHFSGQKAAT